MGNLCNKNDSDIRNRAYACYCCVFIEKTSDDISIIQPPQKIVHTLTSPEISKNYSNSVNMQILTASTNPSNTNPNVNPNVNTNVNSKHSI